MLWWYNSTKIKLIKFWAFALKGRPMTILSLIFEFIPVVLAIIAIPELLLSLNRGRQKTLVLTAVLCCILLIIAQTGWTQALLSNNEHTANFIDKLWTVFNSLVMVTFILW